MTIYNILVGYYLVGPRDCRKGYIWCNDGTFVEPSKFKGCRNKLPVGYAINDSTVAGLSKGGMMISRINLEDYASNIKNSGIECHIPTFNEAKELLSLVSGGQLHRELKEAGLNHLCNYNKISDDGLSNGWSRIWIRSEVKSCDQILYTIYHTLDYKGVLSLYENEWSYFIPFFKVR